MHSKLTRSYGRKKARKLREQPQTALDTVLPLVQLDPDHLFASSDPVWLEIGFGGGEHLLEQLKRNPTVNIIGCEPFINGVAKLLSHLPEDSYNRLKIWNDDVRYLLEKIPDAYFERLFILFPDPWPKKRHQRRRLISPEFMETILPKLKKDSLLHVASDDESYVEQIWQVLNDNPNLTLEQGPLSADPSTWQERPEGWPHTKYEKRALQLGKKCAYMVFKKTE